MTEQAHRDPEEAYAGKDLGARLFVATEEILRNYYEGLGIDAAWYIEHSLYDRPVAPSMILTAVDGGFPGAGLKNSFGTLWMRQEWDIRKPIVPRASYRVTSRIPDIYEHRGRTVVNQETTLWDLEGEMMAQSRHHQSYLLDQSSGRVKLRDPKAKEAARRFVVPESESIEPVARAITLEMCGTFFHGNANYHTDKKEAEALGFADVVVGGRMTLSYIGDMMDKRFGRGWYEGGTLDIKFTNIVWPGDHVVARGVVAGRAKECGDTRANVAVWMENEDGTVVIVGTATALE